MSGLTRRLSDHVHLAAGQGIQPEMHQFSPLKDQNDQNTGLGSDLNDIGT